MPLQPREGSLIQWDPDRERPEPPKREKPRTELRWVKTRDRGYGAVVGPVELVKVGATVEAYDESLGRHRRVRVSAVGRTFHRGNRTARKMMRYGYPTPPSIAKKG